MLLPDGSYSVVFIADRRKGEAFAKRMAWRRAQEICPDGFVQLPPDMKSIEVSSCHAHCWRRPSKAQIWIRCEAPKETDWEASERLPVLR